MGQLMLYVCLLPQCQPGAGMSSALQEIRLRKILPTGIRLVGTDLTIPKETAASATDCI